MRISRALVAAVSGVGYPSLGAVVAAGMVMFAASEVFAEAGLPPLCSEPVFHECAAENGPCTTCGHVACRCDQSQCFDLDSQKYSPAIQCRALYSSCKDARYKDCEGKTEGESCGPNKACGPSGGCDVLDGGAYVHIDGVLGCFEKGFNPDAFAPPAEPPRWDTSLDAGHPPEQVTGEAGASANPVGSSPASSSLAFSDNSGCALSTPGASRATVLASSSLTLGLALLWRWRRRRGRR